MPRDLYRTAAWADLCARAKARDGYRCSVARLLGGSCAPRLDCHHLVPVSEGGAEYDLDNVLTVCATHHPMLEALRRYVVKRRSSRRRCRHRHVYPGAREACERRLAKVG